MKIKYLLMIMLLSVTFISCNKWLDVKSQLRIDQNDIYSTEAGYKSVLNGCYYQLMLAYSTKMTMSTVEYLAQHWDEPTSKDEQVLKLKDFDYSANDVKRTMDGIYSSIYNVIVQVNDLLIHLEQNGEDVISNKDLRNVIKGEALAIRAFCHFDILRLFGQLPVPEAAIKVDLPYNEDFSITTPPSYNFDEFVSKVIKDFSEAETLLKESDPVLDAPLALFNDPVQFKNKFSDLSSYYLYRGIKFNYFAVKSLMARVFLYTRDYDNAYIYASDVIEAKNVTFAGEQDYTNTYYTQPSETFMSLDFYNIEKKTLNFFKPENSNTSEILLSKKMDAVLFSQEVFGYTHWRTTNVINDPINIGERMTTRKYLQPDDKLDAKFGNHNILPIIRLSEVYLIAIEAAELGAKGTSSSLLAQYQLGKGLEAIHNQPEILDEVFLEYRREFYAEGQMFFAYKRLFKKKMLWKSEAIEEKDYIVLSTY